MNDEQDPALDPREEERVRALLAELGSAPDASTMPPEVAARLDETLAGLVAERGDAADAESADGTVVPLRRRWAPRAAAAAAAVIVVGVGGVAAANLGLFNGSQESASEGGSTSATAESLQDSSTAPVAPNPVTGEVPAVSAAGFDADVARLLRDGTLADTYDNASGLREQAEKDARADSRRLSGCPGPSTRAGVQRTLVVYDGTLAVLLVHPARKGERLVEAWTCAGDRVLDSARVPIAVAPADQSSPGSTGLASPGPSPQD